MRKTLLISMSLLLAGSALAAPSQLTVSSTSFKNNDYLSPKYTLTQPGDNGAKLKFGGNISPQLSWSWTNGKPADVKSYAVIATDISVPKTTYFDVEGHMIKASTPRMTAYHWVVANIPATMTELKEGAGSNTINPKPAGQTDHGLVGLNVYQGWFKMHPMLVGKNMSGERGDYDGTSPPWNDEAPHQYHFTVYALNIAKLDLPSNGQFTGPDLLKAMQGHIVGQAYLTAKFTNNPALKK